MADFVQRDGEYPRLPDVPELIHKSSPYPFMMYIQADNEYPRMVGLPEVVPIEPPTPYLLYMQNARVNKGYPYIDTPKMYKVLKNPYPFLIQQGLLTPKSIKFNCTFTKSVKFKVTLNCNKDEPINTDVIKYKVPIVKRKKFTIYF